MKKILILLLIPLLLTGCIKQNNITKENQPLPDNKKEEVIETYKDDNNTPISIYELNGNTLTKQTKIIKKEKMNCFEKPKKSYSNIFLYFYFFCCFIIFHIKTF